MCDVRFIEAAGQDIRVLFEGEQFHGPTTPELKSLADYCRHSDIVIFLVNLADFLGKKESESKASNEAAIKAAMDTLSHCGRAKRFCIVITQADMFHGELDRLKTWNAVLKAHLGNIYGAYVHGGKAQVFPVSAVSDTVAREDGNGRMIRVPKAGFKSEGLENFIQWLQTNTEGVAKEILDQPVMVVQQPAPPAQQPTTHVNPEKSRWASILSPFASLILCIMVLPNTCTHSVTTQGEDTRTWWEKMMGYPIPTTTKDVANVITIVIITLIVCVISFVIARAIEDENS